MRYEKFSLVHGKRIIDLTRRVIEESRQNAEQDRDETGSHHDGMSIRGDPDDMVSSMFFGTEETSVQA